MSPARPPPPWERKRTCGQARRSPAPNRPARLHLIPANATYQPYGRQADEAHIAGTVLRTPRGCEPVVRIGDGYPVPRPLIGLIACLALRSMGQIKIGSFSGKRTRNVLNGISGKSVSGTDPMPGAKQAGPYQSRDPRREPHAPPGNRSEALAGNRAGQRDAKRCRTYPPIAPPGIPESCSANGSSDRRPPRRVHRLGCNPPVRDLFGWREWVREPPSRPTRISGGARNSG